MALTQTTKYAVLTKSVLFDNSYIKVSHISGDKTQLSLVASFLIAKDSALICQSTYAFIPDLDGGNFIKQAYEYLKTLPEFADATDC